MKTKLLKNKWVYLGVILVLICAVISLSVVFSRPEHSALSLSADSLTLPVSTSKNLEISCSLENAEYTYEVYDENIATIESGIVYAHSVGTTSVRITASANGERAVTSTMITVTENPNDPIVDLPSEVTLYLIDKNESEAEQNGLYNQISFFAYKSYQTSISENVVKVKNNVISAVKEGEAEITFSNSNDGSVQKVLVKVLSVPPEIINLPDSLNLKLSQQVSVDFGLSPSYYTGEAKVTFVSNSEILAIENNKITASSTGNAVVEVLLNDSIVGEIKVLVETSLSCSLKAISDCEIGDNTILLKPNVQGCFTLQLKSENGDAINFSSAEIIADGVEIKRDMNYFHISSSSGGTITIYVPDLGAKLTILVFVV